MFTFSFTVWRYRWRNDTKTCVQKSGTCTLHCLLRERTENECLITGGCWLFHAKLLLWHNVVCGVTDNNNNNHRTRTCHSCWSSFRWNLISIGFQLSTSVLVLVLAHHQRYHHNTHFTRCRLLAFFIHAPVRARAYTHTDQRLDNLNNCISSHESRHRHFAELISQHKMELMAGICYRWHELR